MRKNISLSIFSGLLLGLSWPTYGFTILLFIGLVPLLKLINSINTAYTNKKYIYVFSYSYLTFFIWNIMTTWWIYNSSSFGAIFAILCNSLFYSILCIIYYWSLRRLSKLSSTIFFIAIWISFEKFHLNWDFTWPWLNLGNGFSEKIYWIQWYEYTGIFGGTLWILILNFGFYNLIEFHKKTINKSASIIRLFKLLILILLPLLISFFILKNKKPLKQKANIILVQPNIDPYKEKYFTTNTQNLKLITDLVNDHLNDTIDYIIAPETFFSEGNGEDIDQLAQSNLLRSIYEFSNQYKNLNIISGIQLFKIKYGKDPIDQNSILIKEDFWANFYNSAIQINNKDNYQIYNKSKFVPGVEMMPYKSFFNPLIGDFMLDLGGTVSSRTPQKNRLVFTNSNLNISTAPIICYESIYGSFLTEFTRKGANFFSIITNDGWWGNTEGHKQLLSYSKLRAIENRRSIARSANTGISAFINIYGEIESILDYDKKGILKRSLFLNDEITFYVKYGDFIARFAVFFSLILLSIALSGRFKA